MAGLWALLGAGAVLLLAATASPVLGFKSLTVLSGSMEPEIDAGDLVISEGISPLDANLGDVVTFPEPGGTRLITHRLLSMRAGDGRVRMVTKGDANDTVERWTVRTNGEIGRVAYRLPRVGYLVSWVRDPLGRLGLVVLPAILLCIYELVRIWRPRRKEGVSGGIAT